MTVKIEHIRQALTDLAKGDDLFTMLMEFDRTLDQLEIFAYKNWYHGEIIGGPFVSRYWFGIRLMYPHGKMPDPNAIPRLQKIGAKVNMTEDTFTKPVEVYDESDVEDSNTRRAKMETLPVWIVDVSLPMKYITSDIDDLDDYINSELDKDANDLSKEFDKGGDTDVA